MTVVTLATPHDGDVYATTVPLIPVQAFTPDGHEEGATMMLLIDGEPWTTLEDLGASGWQVDWEAQLGVHTVQVVLEETSGESFSGIATINVSDETGGDGDGGGDPDPEPEDWPELGERLYREVAPLAQDDEAHGWALRRFCHALMLTVSELAPLAEVDEKDVPGWGALFAPDTAPAEWLPWLAQFVGVQIPPALDVATQRERIKGTDGFKRGTPAALRAAAAQFLTGTKTVYLTERHGSAYRLTVATLADETPDSAAVLAALMEQKPAGLVLSHYVIGGGADYASLAASQADYAAVASKFASYAEVSTNPTKP